MGALTLKSFPFELRGWDIEKLESIDPTDGFGSITRVYINNNKIIQIEPDFNTNSSNTWLTDKGRQFFDGIFNNWTKDKQLNSYSWVNTFKSITKLFYIFEHCQNQQTNNNFFTIVFENLSLELLSLLNIIAKNKSYIKIRRVEPINNDNDLEANFQLNSASNKLKLNTSTICLLVSNNPRYEGSNLNINLRQRFLKGNFKCYTIGSLIDLTFPIKFLGSNLNILKTIVEGNNLLCQQFLTSKNPLIVLNYELLKRNDGKNNLKMLEVLKNTNLFTNSWNGLNVLSPSLNEVGTQSINKFQPLNKKDLTCFSMLYLLNVTTNNSINLTKLIKLKLLNTNKNIKNINNLIIDQNYYADKNNPLAKLFNTNYLYLPASMFYETTESYINTEGFIKRTTKTIFKNKNNWQIVRKILNHITANFTFLAQTNNNTISFNSLKIINFKNYSNFHFQATQSLTNFNFYLNNKNESFFLTENNFKKKSFNIKMTKLKYWLNDFFNNGKDEYSNNSLVLANCSKITRIKSTNFF